MRREHAWAMTVAGVLAMLLTGCATIPTVKEVGAKMKACLDAVSNAGITKADMLEQAGPPSVREPLEGGGELWVYNFQKQESINVPDQVVTVKNRTYNLGGGGMRTNEYSMRVNIKFNGSGNMNHWAYNGNLAAFPDNPFTRLMVPHRTMAPVSSTVSPAPAVRSAAVRPAPKTVQTDAVNPDTAASKAVASLPADCKAGEEAKERGAFDIGIQRLTKCIESGEVQGDVLATTYGMRAICWRGKKQYDRAIEDLNRAIELAPRKWLSYALRGNIWTDKEQWDQAIRDYSRAIELDPNNSDMYFLRGFSRRRSGRPDKAVEDYSRVVQLKPNDIDSYVSRLAAHVANGNLEGAMEDYRKAMSLNPQKTTESLKKEYPDGLPWEKGVQPKMGVLPAQALDKPDAPRPAEVWVTDNQRRVRAVFNAFPDGWTIRWEGGSVQHKNGALLADGKGIVRIYDRQGEEQGCYVGVFKAGHPEGQVRLIRKDPAGLATPGLSLGGVPW
jgi:tetratricopeptide (TPR) repeat protein